MRRGDTHLNKTLLSLALGAAFPWLASPASAQTAAQAATQTTTTPALPADEAPERVKSLGVVTVTGGRPTSLPTQIPTTIEGVTREEIETRINATDSEDALKYLPSLLVRKRYIGDYNHAILSTRASGTGNSARSAVYADGILLSNYLGNGIANGTNYAPRWRLIRPEESSASLPSASTTPITISTGTFTRTRNALTRPNFAGTCEL